MNRFYFWGNIHRSQSFCRSLCNSPAPLPNGINLELTWKPHLGLLHSTFTSELIRRNEPELAVKLHHMSAEGKRASAIDAHYHSKLTKDPREEAYVLILVHDSKKRHQCIKKGISVYHSTTWMLTKVCPLSKNLNLWIISTLIYFIAAAVAAEALHFSCRLYLAGKWQLADNYLWANAFPRDNEMSYDMTVERYTALTT